MVFLSLLVSLTSLRLWLESGLCHDTFSSPAPILLLGGGATPHWFCRILDLAFALLSSY